VAEDGKNRNRLFKNVVAQFIGPLCLITQGNYKNLEVKAFKMPKIERKIKIK